MIKAIVPLAEALRSSPRGRPVSAMRFKGYEVPPPFNGFGGDEAGVPAVIPRGPKPKDDSAAAEL
ncbi:MAG: hypothetical protein ACLPH3_03930 [Terracidiphilus sp.]